MLAYSKPKVDIIVIFVQGFLLYLIIFFLISVDPAFSEPSYNQQQIGTYIWRQETLHVRSLKSYSEILKSSYLLIHFFKLRCCCCCIFACRLRAQPQQPCQVPRLSGFISVTITHCAACINSLTMLEYIAYYLIPLWSTANVNSVDCRSTHVVICACKQSENIPATPTLVSFLESILYITGTDGYCCCTAQQPWGCSFAGTCCRLHQAKISSNQASIIFHICNLWLSHSVACRFWYM